MKVAKSGIFFSANVRMDKQIEIKHMLGVSNDLGDSKYLGLPSLIGRAKKSVFNFIKERIWRRVQNWNHKSLSKAGKSVMIKNVAQSIPTYRMSCFLIPKSLCTEMERLMNGYWWGSGGNNAKGIRWFGWNKMARVKGKFYVEWDLGSQRTAEKGFSLDPGDGKDIKIFHDPWLEMHKKPGGQKSGPARSGQSPVKPGRLKPGPVPARA
ncbi:hypothetical protein AgCh_013044 [Apium graveolens]